MPGKIGIDWDGPAELVLDGAGEQPLWSYCSDRIKHGPKGTASRLAAEIGVAWNTMTSAIQRREQKAGGSKPVAEPTQDPAHEPAPTPVDPPEHMDSTPEPEPTVDVVYQAPEAADAPGEPREHVDLVLDPAVVREFLIVMGMGQLFAGFALARSLDAKRAA